MPTNAAVRIIDLFWKDKHSLNDVYGYLQKDVPKLSAAIAGVIGRHLLMRIKELSTPEFAMAAFLASNGEAGNDSKKDFIDCVAILPQERYYRILGNHDTLIDDPVAKEFGEFGFYNLFESKFESAFEGDGDGLLSFLVYGEAEDIGMCKEKADVDSERLFPKLFQRYGQIIDRLPTKYFNDNRVSLDDFC